MTTNPRPSPLPAHVSSLDHLVDANHQHARNGVRARLSDAVITPCNLIIHITLETLVTPIRSGVVTALFKKSKVQDDLALAMPPSPNLPGDSPGGDA